MRFRNPQNIGTYGSFNSIKSQRDFLESIAKKFGISKPSEWTKIDKEKITSFEGGAKLLKIYDKSIFRLLSRTFPEVTWKSEWFSPRTQTGFWPNCANQRLFLDSVAKKLDLKKPRDWGKITHIQIRKFKGGGVLLNQYGGSLKRALENLYPEIGWRTEWFGRYPKEFWWLPENQRDFLKYIAREYNLQNPQDWRRINISLIKDLGGKGLLKRHNNSIFSALRVLYPELDWNIYEKRNSFPQQLALSFLKSKND